MSYNGTVRCGNCYESGHNKTGCPDLRKAWEQDPTSYKGRQWQRILDRKAKPKICSYCDTTGHTRAGCESAKKHKAQFQMDLNLWRKALVKWMGDTGLGIGALVRCNNAAYYRGSDYMYPQEENYVPPVGMVMCHPNQDLTHYNGIMNSGDWRSAPTLISFDYIGAPETEASYRKVIGCSLPSIPGIVPRYGKAWYGGEHADRDDRNQNMDWEVVSAGQADFSSDSFLSPKELKKATKVHFAAQQEQTERAFKTFTDFQRKQLQQYVNGEIELSEMKDPEVPND